MPYLDQTRLTLETRHRVDVEQFIRAFAGVLCSKCCWLSEHAQPFHLDALDQIRAFDIQPRNDAETKQSPPPTAPN